MSMQIGSSKLGIDGQLNSCVGLLQRQCISLAINPAVLNLFPLVFDLFNDGLLKLNFIEITAVGAFT